MGSIFYVFSALLSLNPWIEAVTLSCGNASQGTAVYCTCSNSGGLGVDWLVNGIYLTTCISYFSCVPNQASYTFLMDSAADMYFLTINSHSYSQCGVYECRDVGSPSKDLVEISISDKYLDTTWEPEEQIQPGNHTDGNFSVTSPCLFGVNVNTVKIQWFTVSNGNKELYFPGTSSVNYMTVSCQACKGVTATQLQISFLHTESSPGDKTVKEVRFVLEIYNISISFSGVYFIFETLQIVKATFIPTVILSNNNVSEEIQQGNDTNYNNRGAIIVDKNSKNYLPIVIGIVTAVLVIVGITLGMVIYVRRYKQNTDSENTDRSYDNICGMNTGGNNINRELVYEGLKPIDERGYVEVKEQTYDILKPKDSAENKYPVYTNS